MPSFSSRQSCALCDKKSTKCCSRCKSISYCSKECQKDDWSTHKLLCASFTTFASSNRPTADHRRAVLFDPDRAKPEFIWLFCKRHHGDDNSRHQVPEIDTIIGSNTTTNFTSIEYNSRRKRVLPSTITIAYCDTFLVDGSQPNRSMASIQATQPGEHHDWRGPIVAYAGQDFDMVTFRNLADYILSYGHTPIGTEKTSVERVKGVKINCLGDVKVLKRPHFEAIEVPATDGIFTKHDTSDIAERIGISILTRRCTPDPRWANREDATFQQSSFVNQHAAFLQLCCDPDAELDLGTGSLGWGFSPMQWQDDVGSLVVVRKDKKPLLPLHMEALAGYCRNEVQPLMGHSNGEYYPEEPMKKDDVLRTICRPMFAIYWNKFTEYYTGLHSPESLL